MIRKIYEPTKNQERKWAKFEPPQMPTDDEFRERWAKGHHGRERGWGIGKRIWVLAQMTQSREYQMGLWQGRVDRARGLDYAEERNENTYNLGYHRGYTGYESNRRGWDAATRQRFDEKYVSAPANTAYDFDHTGLGIGGLGRHEEPIVIPTVEQIKRIEHMEARATHCSRCGASDVFDGAMFTTGGGDICDDCFG